jgi:sterol 14-demethylase
VTSNATRGSLDHLPDGTPPGGADRLAMRVDPYTYHLAGYRRAGPVHRLRLGGSELVVAAGPEVNDFVYRHSDLWDYPTMMAIFRETFSDRYLTAMAGDAHQSKRRRFAAAFRSSVLDAGVPTMAAAVDRTVESASSSDVVDLRRLCNHLVFDQTAALFDVAPAAGAAELFLEFEHRLLSGTLGDAGPLRAELYDELGRILDAKLAKGGDDPLASVLDDDGRPVPRAELLDDLAMLFLAGTETTAHVILWSLIELARDSSWAARVDDEVGGWRIADPERLDLPAVRATVLEAERRYPPLPIGLLIGFDDVDLLGHRIPAGTQILHARTLTHFLEECYPDPMAYRPQRHLGRSHPSRVQGAFGGGSHHCLGFPLARIQSALAVALVRRDWDLTWRIEPPTTVRTDAVVTPDVASVAVTIRRRH